jgi:hypothetical protein
VVVDTTVQPKAVAYPTDAKLYDDMRRRLVRMARREGLARISPQEGRNGGIDRLRVDGRRSEGESTSDGI